MSVTKCPPRSDLHEVTFTEWLITKWPHEVTYHEVTHTKWSARHGFTRSDRQSTSINGINRLSNNLNNFTNIAATTAIWLKADGKATKWLGTKRSYGIDQNLPPFKIYDLDQWSFIKLTLFEFWMKQFRETSSKTVVMFLWQPRTEILKMEECCEQKITKIMFVISRNKLWSQRTALPGILTITQKLRFSWSSVTPKSRRQTGQFGSSSSAILISAHTLMHSLWNMCYNENSGWWKLEVGFRKSGSSWIQDP